jgi:hypothetical protein
MRLQFSVNALGLFLEIRLTYFGSPFLLYLRKKVNMVQDLINQIVEKTGVPADKAQQVLNVVAGFVKQKYPMVGGQIDNILGSKGGDPGTDSSAGNFMSDIGGKMGF